MRIEGEMIVYADNLSLVEALSKARHIASFKNEPPYSVVISSKEITFLNGKGRVSFQVLSDEELDLKEVTRLIKRKLRDFKIKRA